MPSSLSTKKAFKPALAGVLAIACGVLLWQMPLGERWVRSSYDYLFRFGTRSVTNKVVLIEMDNEAFSHEPRQERGHWDRQVHADLLERLAADNCPLVVIDSIFRSEREPKAKDDALATAI